MHDVPCKQHPDRNIVKHNTRPPIPGVQCHMTAFVQHSLLPSFCASLVWKVLTDIEVEQEVGWRRWVHDRIYH